MGVYAPSSTGFGEIRDCPLRWQFTPRVSLTLNPGYRVQGYSILTLAALMTGVQRAISLLTSAASAAWPRRSLGGMSQPRSMRRLRTFSSSSALSRASVSLSRIGLGVALGAKSPYQPVAWKSGSPASLVVGRFGSAGLRAGVATA